MEDGDKISKHILETSRYLFAKYFGQEKEWNYFPHKWKPFIIDAQEWMLWEKCQWKFASILLQIHMKTNQFQTKGKVSLHLHVFFFFAEQSFASQAHSLFLTLPESCLIRQKLGHFVFCCPPSEPSFPGGCLWKFWLMAVPHLHFVFGCFSFSN